MDPRVHMADAYRIRGQDAAAVRLGTHPVAGEPEHIHVEIGKDAVDVVAGTDPAPAAADTTPGLLDTG